MEEESQLITIDISENLVQTAVIKLHEPQKLSSCFAFDKNYSNADHAVTLCRLGALLHMSLIKKMKNELLLIAVF